jgi:hypothetical protein
MVEEQPALAGTVWAGARRKPVLSAGGGATSQRRRQRFTATYFKQPMRHVAADWEGCGKFIHYRENDFSL